MNNPVLNRSARGGQALKTMVTVSPAARDAACDPAHFAVHPPVRVLFVWDHLGYPNGATHGLTRYCLNVLPRLDRAPVEMTVCFLREHHPAAEALAARGIDPIFLGRSKWDPRAMVDVIRLIRQRRIDVVHAVGQKGVLVGRTAGKLLGCGTIVHLRDIFPMSVPVRLALRAGARWTDIAQGVSRAVCRHAVSWYGIPEERVRLLYNGILPEQFAPVAPGEVAAWRRDNGYDADHRLIGVVGRLAPEKGHLRLLRQIARVSAAVPGVRVVFAGDGPCRPEIEREIGRLRLDGVVRLLGQREDVRTLIGALDVLAVPSDHEGLSFVALEALMLGTPVVGTAVGGLAEVLGEGQYGTLFDPTAPDSLGDALIDSIQRSDEARTRARAAADHLRLFDMTRHVEAQREIYIGLAAQVRARRAPTATGAAARA